MIKEESKRASRARQDAIGQLKHLRTIDLRGCRLQIRKWATNTLKTSHGDRRIWWVAERRRWPGRPSKKWLDEISEAYAANPEPFGRYMAGKLEGSRKSNIEDLKKRLSAVLDESNPYPFAVVENVFPSHSWFYEQTKESDWYVKQQCYDFISSGLIHLAGLEHKLKAHTGHPKRTLTSSPASLKDALTDGNDLPLRYRQATPELKFIGDTTRAVELAARMIVFACVENTTGEPIYLMPTSLVFRNLPKTLPGISPPTNTLDMLSAKVYTLFDTRDEEQLLLTRPTPQQPLTKHGGSPEAHWMSLDVNRMDLQERMPAEHRVALKTLLETIERVEKDPSLGAIPITLKRGDALIVDNYRVLHRRHEISYHRKHAFLFGRSPMRCLYLYYGFPKLH